MKIDEDRKAMMLSMYTTEHKTLQEIGDVYKITKERVRQILTTCPEYHKTKSTKSIVEIVCKNCGKHKELTKSKAKNASFCNMSCFRKYQQKETASKYKDGVKKCTACGSELSLKLFYKRGKHSYYSQCKKCRNEKIKQHNAEKRKTDNKN